MKIKSRQVKSLCKSKSRMAFTRQIQDGLSNGYQELFVLRIIRVCQNICKSIHTVAKKYLSPLVVPSANVWGCVRSVPLLDFCHGASTDLLRSLAQQVVSFLIPILGQRLLADMLALLRSQIFKVHSPML